MGAAFPVDIGSDPHHPGTAARLTADSIATKTSAALGGIMSSELIENLDDRGDPGYGSLGLSKHGGGRVRRRAMASSRSRPAAVRLPTFSSCPERAMIRTAPHSGFEKLPGNATFTDTTEIS